MCNRIYKLALLGNSGLGKSTFIKKHITGVFETQYLPTVGLEVHPVKFHTNEGNITFNVWDISGSELNRGFLDGYLTQTNCAIIFHDIKDPIMTNTLVKKLKTLNINTEIVVVNSFMDTLEFEPPKNELTKHYYLAISSKSNYNLEKPFLYLARFFTKNTNLHFIEPDINSSKDLNTIHNKNQEEVVGFVCRSGDRYYFRYFK